MPTRLKVFIGLLCLALIYILNKYDILGDLCFVDKFSRGCPYDYGESLDKACPVPKRHVIKVILHRYCNEMRLLIWVNSYNNDTWELIETTQARGVARIKNRWGRNFLSSRGNRYQNIRFEFNNFESEILKLFVIYIFFGTKWNQFKLKHFK